MIQHFNTYISNMNVMSAADLVILHGAVVQVGAHLEDGIGALTFGVQLPDCTLSFPTAPGWILYTGNATNCLEDMPVVIRRDTFCRAFVAEARMFPRYTSWLLSLLLGQVMPSFGHAFLAVSQCCTLQIS